MNTNKGEGTMQHNGESYEQERLPHPVYFVESPQDDSVLVALDVQRLGDTISWQDTTKERRFNIGEVISQDPNDYRFKTSAEFGDAADYRLTEMTLDTYRLAVKPRLINGRNFNTKEEMIAAFKEAQDNAW